MRRALAGAAVALALFGCRRSEPATSPAPKPASAAPVRPARPPNVLLVVFDDLYYKTDLYGYQALTPNLRRLAQRGRRFDRAYAQYPLCNPSRASFMTGWRPARTRVFGNADPPAATLAGAVPMQDHFRGHGYRTARVGKIYHSPFESEFRWDVAIDPIEEPLDSEDDGFSSRLDATSNDDADEPDGQTARRAAALLEKRDQGPLFLAVGFLRPHGPWVAPRKYFEMYPPARVRLPTVPPGDLLDVPRVVLKRGAEPNIPDEKRQQALAAYYACITFADAQLGVLLDALDRRGLWDSTLVIATSDHGIERGEHGLWRKNVLYEECARVPLVIAAPGMARPGAASEALVELVDLYPTLCDLAGLPPPPGLDGLSLRPLLDDPAAALRSAAFTVSHRGRRLAVSMRTERYRYTRWRPDAAELFDHAEDPGENRNLADDPARRALVERLEAQLRAGPRGALLPR